MTLRLEDYITSTPDFPKPGILFRDFSPLLMHAEALSHAIDRLADLATALAPDYILAPEARGFVFGPAVAVKAKAGFLPARKPESSRRSCSRTPTTSSTGAPSCRSPRLRSCRGPAW